MGAIDATLDALELVRAYDGNERGGVSAGVLLRKYEVQSGSNGALVGALLGMALSFGRRLARELNVELTEVLDDVVFNAIALAEDDERHDEA